MALLKHFNSLEELTAEMKAITASINKKLGIKPKKKKKLKIVKWLPNSAELVFSNPDLREIIFKKKVELIQTKFTLRNVVVNYGEIKCKGRKKYEIKTNSSERKKEFDAMVSCKFGSNEKPSKKFQCIHLIKGSNIKNFYYPKFTKNEKDLIIKADNYLRNNYFYENDGGKYGNIFIPIHLNPHDYEKDLKDNNIEFAFGSWIEEQIDMTDDIFDYYELVE